LHKIKIIVTEIHYASLCNAQIAFSLHLFIVTAETLRLYIQAAAQFGRTEENTLSANIALGDFGLILPFARKLGFSHLR
jgi:hypothetical protein